MNDHEAMSAINTVLDAWFKGKRGALESLQQIARISGENTIEHMEAKEQK